MNRIDEKTMKSERDNQDNQKGNFPVIAGAEFKNQAKLQERHLDQHLPYFCFSATTVT
jgi:hypothetical protein